MKRSTINALIEQAQLFVERMQFALPPFAGWTAAHWAQGVGADYNHIRDTMLGWDITDFGSGDFERIGLLLFTLRNGSLHNPAYPQPYAEKILIVREGQVTPCHFHFQKMEDIICRGGGNLLVRVHNSTPEGGLSDSDVTLTMDGRRLSVPAGTVLRLTPGQSITLPAGLYHSFWGEPGSGMTLLGEVSCVNDDTRDNRFYEPVGRFARIEEDEPARWLLCNEYPPCL